MARTFPQLAPIVLTGLLVLQAVQLDGQVRLRETASAWGLDFRHHHAGSGRYYHPETVGSGLILFDYDLDGDVDVFLIDAGPLPGYDGEPPASRLFRNDGVGLFVEVTAIARISVRDYGMGGSAGDIDGDQDLDLYVTAFGGNQLFRNDGDGRFTDITIAAGVGDRRWSSSAAFADADGDGDLDLYVVNYLDYDLEEHVLCSDPESGIPGYCHPANLKAEQDAFYRNRGDGSFEDATRTAGLAAANGKGLGVVFTDLDGDHHADLYVANDTTPNLLFRNRGDGSFEDSSLLSGTAFGDRMTAEAGMGIAIGDVDSNGYPDLVVTNFALETNAFYRNEGGSLFSDVRWLVGIAQSSLRMLGFGAGFGDLDQDGRLDLVIANGHIFPSVERTMEGITYRQRNQLFRGQDGGRFVECLDCGLDQVRVSRGLALGDLDGDLDLDLVITNSNDLAEVYENVDPTGGRSVLLELAGGRPNTHSVGARIEVVTADKSRFGQLLTASSYLSQGPSSLHFGLGPAAAIDELRIRWPDGRQKVYLGLSTDQALKLYGDPGPTAFGRSSEGVEGAAGPTR